MFILSLLDINKHVVFNALCGVDTCVISSLIESSYNSIIYAQLCTINLIARAVLLADSLTCIEHNNMTQQRVIVLQQFILSTLIVVLLVLLVLVYY